MTTQYEDQQLEMFGCLVKDIKGGAILVNTNDPRELNNYAICILSDAQSVLANGDAEKARQFINKAKYLLSESSDILRKQESEASTSRPFAEPDCLKTEDGYIFYRLDDGSYADDRNELHRDLSYKSLSELSQHVDWRAVDENAKPSCVKTEDGYVFFRMDDGSYVDDRNELTRDLSYKSLIELGRHVSWEPIDEDDDESPGMK